MTMPSLLSFFSSRKAVLKPYENRELPAWFSSPSEEYRTLRDAAILVGPLGSGFLALMGAKTQDLLHRITTQDIRSLSPGQGRYALFLTNKGRVVADFVAFHKGDHFLLQLEDPALIPGLMDQMGKYAFLDDVELEDRSAHYEVLTVQGPKASGLLEQAADIKALHWAPKDVARIGCMVVNRDRNGAGGFDIIVPAEATVEVWTALESAGALPAGREALEAARIEAGQAVGGRDFDERHIALEACLGHAINFTKGCYPGQEIIARMDSQGHANRLLKGLIIDGEDPVPIGTPLYGGTPEKPAGEVMSSIRHPLTGKVIALAYVRKEYWEPGTVVMVEVSGSTLKATVSAFPMIFQ